MKSITRAEAIAIANEVGEIAELERKIGMPKYLRWQTWEEDERGEFRTFDPQKKIHIAANQERGEGSPLCCEAMDGDSPTVFYRIAELAPWNYPVSEDEVCKTCLKIWRAR